MKISTACQTYLQEQRFSVAHMASSREETEGNTCTLCLGKSTNMSMPRIWKSIPAQEVASTLHVEQHGPECRSCRSDITTLLEIPCKPLQDLA